MHDLLMLKATIITSIGATAFIPALSKVVMLTLPKVLSARLEVTTHYQPRPGNDQRGRTKQDGALSANQGHKRRVQIPQQAKTRGCLRD